MALAMGKLVSRQVLANRDLVTRLSVHIGESRHPGVTWIFAYGSLMGDNALRFYQGIPAHLEGYRRAFLHASTKRWGTPEHPCPILGLAPQGECMGVAFEIPAGDERSLVRNIERREGQEEYDRKRVQVRLAGGGDVAAVAWVTKRRVLNAPPWPEDAAALERAFREAHGVVGTGVEYVRTLIHALERWQIHDPMVESLWGSLKPYSNPRG
jgi:cation transport protein ChaC